MTLINFNTAQSIGARGPRLNIFLKGVMDRETTAIDSEKVQLTIKGSFGSYEMNSAITVKNLALPLQSISNEMTDIILKDEGIQVDSYCNARPTILIGQDNWQLITSRELRENKRFGIAVTRTNLGWVLHGNVNRSINDDKSGSVYAIVGDSKRGAAKNPRIQDVQLEELMTKYFELETLGTNRSFGNLTAHKNASIILAETTKFTGKGYETGLLWKPHDKRASETNSFSTARKRLFSLENRLDKDPTYANMYYNEMNRFIELGYAEKIDADTECERIWYLPHFGVRKPNKPRKIRLVFDAAAKSSGVSLNDQLESGPDLLEALLGVLLRFRQYEFAVKGDIRDMYLRVQVRKQDQGAQRFLWRGRDRQKKPDVYQMKCLIFGAKSSPCGALFVKNKNAERFAKTHPNASNAIIKNSYMDDFLLSVNDLSEAAKLVREVIRINAEARFEMYDWASNDPRVLQSVSEQNLAKEDAKNELGDRQRERVLGLFWDPRRDELTFDASMQNVASNVLDENHKPTKRQFLSVIMSVFDPLGLLSPFTIRSRILMQDVWRSGIGWDEPLRDEENAGWRKWAENLEMLPKIRIPRCYAPKESRNLSVELHTFCDASFRAYAAAIYLRFTRANEPPRTSLVMAKAKVAPVKPLSIPRLELQAALLGARLATAVAKEIEIKIDRRVFWSDSMVVVNWIRADPQIRQVFVAHRLGEIGK